MSLIHIWAFTADDLDGLGAVVVQLFDNAGDIVLDLLQPDSGQLDLTLALPADDLGLRRGGYLRELHAHDLLDHGIYFGYGVAGLTVAFAGMPDVVAVSYTHLDVYKRQVHDPRVNGSIRFCHNIPPNE